MEQQPALHAVFSNRDLLFCIARLLPPRELCNLAQVSKTSAAVTSHRTLWEPLCNLALSLNKAHRKIISGPGFTGYLDSPQLNSYVFSKEEPPIDQFNWTWKDAWSLLILGKRRAPDLLTMQKALKVLVWFACTSGNCRSLLTAYLNFTGISSRFRTCMFVGIKELIGRPSPAFDNVVEWLRSVVIPACEATSWDLRMEALTALAKVKPDEALALRSDLLAHVKGLEAAKGKSKFGYASTYSTDLARAILIAQGVPVPTVPGRLPPPPMPVHQQWLRSRDSLATGLDTRSVDALNETTLSTSLAEVLLVALSVREPNNALWKKPPQGVSVLSLLWHCCQLNAVELEAPVDPPLPFVACTNIFSDCMTKISHFEMRDAWVVAVHLSALPKSGATMRSHLRNLIEPMITHAAVPREVQMKALTCFHHLGGHVSNELLSSFTSKDPQAYEECLAKLPQLPKGVQEVIKDEIARGPRLSCPPAPGGYYGPTIHAGWARELPNKPRRTKYVCSEVKGKVVLPDEYANFRKALVKAGFIFSEERDCVAKGMGFSMAFRSGRSQDKLDVQLSSLTIVGTIRPERHRCDYPSVYDKVEQSGSRDAATKKIAALMKECGIPYLEPSLRDLEILWDRTVGEVLFC